MRSIASILLAFVLLGNGMIQSWTWLNYQLNRAAIEKKFCENRNRPELQCHGKCHLKKQLEKQEENRNPVVPAGKGISAPEAFSNNIIGIPAPEVTAHRPAGCLPAAPKAKNPADIFHPPIV